MSEIELEPDSGNRRSAEALARARQTAAPSVEDGTRPPMTRIPGAGTRALPRNPSKADDAAPSKSPSKPKSAGGQAEKDEGEGLSGWGREIGQEKSAGRRDSRARHL